MTEDSRRSPRRRLFYGARILTLDNNSSFSCTIKSRSDTGYGIEVGSSLGIPDKVYLVENYTSERKLCRVVWRRSKQLGLELINDEQEDKKPYNPNNVLKDIMAGEES